MLFRIIKFAFQNFYRNFWLALVTITMLVVTLFSITTLITLNVVTDQVVKSIEDKILGRLESNSSSKRIK